MSKTQQLLAAATPAPWLTHLDGGLIIGADITSSKSSAWIAWLPTQDDAVLAAYLRNTADAAQAVIEAAREWHPGWPCGYCGTHSDDHDYECKWAALQRALAAYDEVDK